MKVVVWILRGGRKDVHGRAIIETDQSPDEIEESLRGDDGWTDKMVRIGNFLFRSSEVRAVGFDDSSSDDLGSSFVEGSEREDHGESR